MAFITSNGAPSLEAIQDLIAPGFVDTASINFTYTDGSDQITADVLPAGVDHNSLANLATGDVHTQYFKVTGRSNESLTLSGTGRILNINGSASLPSYGFSSDANTGMYLSGADALILASAGLGQLGLINGNEVRIIDSALTWQTDNSTDIGASGASRARDLFLGRNANIGGTHTVVGRSFFAAGTDSLPSITFSGDSDTGFYSAGTNILGLAAGGVNLMTLGPTVVSVNSDNLTLADPGGASVAVGGTLEVNNTQASSASTTETTLATLTIDANHLNTTRHSLDFMFAGSIGASVETKQLKVKFGGTTIFDSGALAIVAARSFHVQGHIMQAASNSQRCIVTVTSNDALLVATSTFTATTFDMASSRDLILTGQVGGAGGTDITHQFSKIILDWQI